VPRIFSSQASEAGVLFGGAQYFGNLLALFGAGGAGICHIVRQRRIGRRRGAVGPGDIDRIARDGLQQNAGVAERFEAIFAVQPWIVAEQAALQVGGDPGGGRGFG
jgi:hypothetical protein